MKVLSKNSKAKNKRAHWAEVIADWRQGGKSRRHFCEEKGISVSTFGYWQKILKPQKDLFVPVKIHAPQKYEAVFYRVEMMLGVNLVIPSGAKSEDLKVIFKALGVVA